MALYKLFLCPDGSLNKAVFTVNMSCIPFDPANTDYRQFKIDVADGEPLEDPDGKVMTQDEVNVFLKTIP